MCSEEALRNVRSEEALKDVYSEEVSESTLAFFTMPVPRSAAGVNMTLAPSMRTVCSGERHKGYAMRWCVGV